MKTFRTYHLIMAFVSVGYIAALVLPFLLIVLYGFIGAMLDWQYIPYESLPFPSDKMTDNLLFFLFPTSIILNTVLFSVRYYVRRDCLSALLCAIVVLLCGIALPFAPHIFYPGKETHPVMIHETIAVMHFLPFLLFNLYYRHEDKRANTNTSPTKKDKTLDVCCHPHHRGNLF